MSYDHSRKAGNLGDVWKHSTLVALADAVPKKSKSFRYVESHTGAPFHRLAGKGEWSCGVARIARNAACDSAYAGMARDWLARSLYPASWVFVAERLVGRFEQVEVVLFDHADDVAAQYPPAWDAGVSASVRRIRPDFRKADGYEAVEGLSGVDLVFLDPPYHPDARRDWRRLRQACRVLLSRCIPFVAWYPFYWHSQPQRLSDGTNCEAWEIRWFKCGPRPSQNLKGCGMLVSKDLAALRPQVMQSTSAVVAGIGASRFRRKPDGGGVPDNDGSFAPHDRS